MRKWNEVQVLLVEDNPTDAELCMAALGEYRLGNRLEWVKDGAQALEFLFGEGAYAERGTNHQPRVVLLDLRLPKVDGLEVLRQIKGDERTKWIPVVVVTSSKEDRDLVDSYKLGVNSYVQKPVQFEAFAKEIAKVGMYWLITNKVPV
ncbi:MAG: response regulator [Pseudomonadota bacterium]